LLLYAVAIMVGVIRQVIRLASKILLQIKKVFVESGSVQIFEAKSVESVHLLVLVEFIRYQCCKNVFDLVG
jgi:hypothetical protein